MCGLVGWQSVSKQDIAPQVLDNALDSIAHRGPDDSGTYFDDDLGIALGHRRLSIIDLSDASHQPMIDPQAGVVIVYNGELYNFRSLRTQLETLGHHFKSRGDTEVVLRAFIQWGAGCFNYFAGMFAVAIWDKPNQSLYLARDPTGMKPLYYGELPDRKGIVFASEIKAWLQIPDFQVNLDQQSLQQFLEFGYTFDQDRTILANVKKIPPGFYLKVQRGKTQEICQYFTPPSALPETLIKPSDQLEHLYATFKQVVSEHLLADVPVGILLSGGLDSSLLTSLASKHGQVTTISMAFAESTIDERANAQIVAQYANTKHHEVIISPNEVIGQIQNKAWIFDDLFSDWGTISTNILYQKCRDMGIKVVLVGEGSDELFAGYGTFVQPHGIQEWQIFKLYQRYAGRRYGKFYPKFRNIFKNYLNISSGDFCQAVRLFESQRQLPNNYVMKVDKASMAASVEARSPFLDRRIAEIAYRLPSNYLLDQSSNKLILREMAQKYDLLPEVVSDRPKFGASIASSWIEENSQFRQFASDVILQPNTWCQKLGLQSAMEDYLIHGKKGYALPSNLSIFTHIAWRLLLLELWSGFYLK
ncbi:asparagine synthase (glutamine-hydrolyzing) [Pseudanabaena mucicola]|uniref:asparagine synthase (glutamine-hydrolyzing) n=1 Tax=Pseudanabaena mucicola FACHB-723 TaxID=2692860 RepID=A0ABR7ZTP2_9CYAN|nr:asparagine synthase (glutamine-hydrolyzing) [Pseudanabaena mucicola]MBD2187090.1 asparagine synthase (glutamine-hydrolyzing) [Pseudanabaena mucicola FACHB-723]